jgi:2-(1,2-epoxy-1,2-dihydrophenyl)acetyl-CoA isomerase
VQRDPAAGVLTITIDRPERRNALTFVMLADLAAAIREADADPEVRAIVLAGVPGAFCSGIDLAELAAADVAADRTAPEQALAILRSDTPVIAAVDGPAVGLGAELALQCDLRFATPRARFAWNFVRLGLVPDTGVGSWLLPRVVGLAAASELLLGGGALDAEQALALGYVSAVIDDGALLEVATARARALAEHSPFAMRRIKRLLRGGLSLRFEDHLRAHERALQECFASVDHAEGVAAFLERRPAAFSGDEDPR